VAQAAIAKADEERAQLATSGEQKQGRKIDRVIQSLPGIAARYRQIVVNLPQSNLPT